MIRVLLLLCCAVLAPLTLAHGQSPAPANATTVAPATTASQISPAQARQVLDVLDDPAKRAQFIATLEAITKSLPASGASSARAPAVADSGAAKAESATPPGADAAPVPTAPAEPKPDATGVLPLAPDSLGADVLLGASSFLKRLSGQAIAALSAIRSVPLLWGWLHVMATDPWARGVLMDTAWRLALLLAGGVAIEFAARWAIQRPIQALVRNAPKNCLPARDDLDDEAGEVAGDGAGEVDPPRRRGAAAVVLLRRVPLVLARLFLELLPVLGFLLFGHLVAASALGGEEVIRLILLAVIDAYAVCAAVLCIARMMFSPEPSLRLLHVGDSVAAYAMRWVRRIAVVSVFGYAVAEVGLLLGLSDSAHEALLKVVVLTDHVFLGIIVLQQRRRVRSWIRAPDGSTGFIAARRNWLAGVWHWIALILLAGVWLIWAVEVQHGYVLLLRYFAVTYFVVLGARLTQIVVVGTVDRMLQVPQATASRYPGIEARLAHYHPFVVGVSRALVYLAATLLLLQFWGLGALSWLLATALGERLISALVTLTVTTLLALFVWEAVNTGVERHLAKLAREAQIARSARLRTLLPLLRSALLISILIVAGMMVLSEIGVNIGPLLAGAGIAGVAIGFGSQKLVQDLITGIFLLLENAMQVGDTVTVSGLTGTVENLSVRTIRLRAGDGSVHIIPFSSVTSVNNVNRGLGNAAVSVTVNYDEDTDRVGTVLKEIVAGMRREKDYSAQMLSDLQLWGVDKVDGASATVVGQVVCTDSGRWNVQREFNRRMKMRFQEVGIEIYNPMRMMALVATPDNAAEQNDGNVAAQCGGEP